MYRAVISPRSVLVLLGSALLATMRFVRTQSLAQWLCSGTLCYLGYRIGGMQGAHAVSILWCILYMRPSATLPPTLLQLVHPTGLLRTVFFWGALLLIGTRICNYIPFAWIALLTPTAMPAWSPVVIIEILWLADTKMPDITSRYSTRALQACLRTLLPWWPALALFIFAPLAAGAWMIQYAASFSTYSELIMTVCGLACTPWYTGYVIAWYITIRSSGDVI